MVSREDLLKSKEYRITRAALDWYQDNQEADSIDGYYAGYTQAESTLTDRACKTLDESLDALLYSRLTIGEWLKQFREKLESDEI